MPEETNMMLGELRAQMSAINDLVKEHREESRDRGKRIFNDLETIRLEASHVKRSVDDLNAWKATVTPQLALMERMKERSIGAWMVVVFISTAAGGAFIAAWKWIAVKLGIS